MGPQRKINTVLSSMADCFVVDFQAFKSLQNHFILKEIGITTLDGKNVYHCIVRPPLSYKYLQNEDFKRRIQYITRNIHGLEWDSGSVTYSDAVSELKTLLKNAERVYIRGSERVAYLDKLLDHKVLVIDLDIFDYRGERALNENAYTSCTLGTPGHSVLKCSLRKALMYRDYICKYLEKPTNK